MGHLEDFKYFFCLARIAERSSFVTIEVVERRFGGSSERKEGAETEVVSAVVVEH